MFSDGVMAFALLSCAAFFTRFHSFTTGSCNCGFISIEKESSANARSGCLVISIGNLTVGGTGKTPIVEKFARALRAGGRRVAILSRGYKSVPRKRDWRSWFRTRLRASAGGLRWKILAARFSDCW